MGVVWDAFGHWLLSWLIGKSVIYLDLEALQQAVAGGGIHCSEAECFTIYQNNFNEENMVCCITILNSLILYEQIEIDKRYNSTGTTFKALSN